MQQSSATPKNQDVGIGVLLLAVPSCTFGTVSSLHLFTNFYICSLIFYPGLALTVARGGHQSKTSEPIANPWSSP